jgi:hypothetical protein
VQREWSVASSTYTRTNRGRKEGAEEGVDEWGEGVGGVSEGGGRDEWGGARDSPFLAEYAWKDYEGSGAEDAGDAGGGH